MGNALARAPLDRNLYLKWEAEQPGRNEYLAGEIFAMVGVRREHALVSLTLGSRLRSHLKGKGCQTFVADMKLFVEAADAYFYPDVMVTCDPRDATADLAIAHPILVIEILSEGTAAFDRGNKFAAYRQLPSLVEYLLVDIEAHRLELYRREADRWLLTVAEGLTQPLWLESVGLNLLVAEAFEDLIA